MTNTDLAVYRTRASIIEMCVRWQVIAKTIDLWGDTELLTRLGYKIHAKLEHYFPERRLFLKSETETRFVRLRSHTQLFIVTGAVMLLSWTTLVTSIVLFTSIGSGSGRDQALRQQSLYEERITALGEDRDRRIEEAAGAQQRFNQALVQVAQMQNRLLASEDRRRELEVAVDVIQNTLRRSIEERDQARLSLAKLEKQGKAPNGAGLASADGGATLELVADALGTAAKERDHSLSLAEKTQEQMKEMIVEKRMIIARNDEIFSQLEEAVAVSIGPLEKMFRSAGLSPDNIIRQIQQNYSGQGGPLGQLILDEEARGPEKIDTQVERVNAILSGLDQMNTYRLAAFKVPFSYPVKGNYRFTSGFGGRRDPINRTRRMHNGTDMAGARGTPIMATADGVVQYVGWESGYGRIVKINHSFGIETFYGHLLKINVKKGQRVSRGDKIGEMGSSGRSTGTHLHYEIHVDKKPVDPMQFMKASKYVF